MAHLNKIVRIPDLPAGLKKIDSEAAMFFDPGMPLAARIEYLLADDTRVQLLLDWGSGGDLESVARLAVRDPYLKDLTAPVFISFCRAVNECGMVGAVKQPVLQERAAFYKVVRESCASKVEFFYKFCGHGRAQGTGLEAQT